MSSQCEALVRDASGGVAAALRAVDCMSAEATATAFGRLFGTNGALLPALTIVLTLYIAFFALSLLTGRSRIGIGALTPRMLTLGLVLTFVTSWAAYQGVVWNLAVGAPDQVAGVLMGGTEGSATHLFAERIDLLFNAIAEAADQNRPAGAAPAIQGSFSPSGLMWMGAMLFMLGTVGILVTARIALAVLLTLGPVFVAMLLFGGTRGLFVGWLRGVILTAITPLFAVLGGAFMVELAIPVVASLRGADGIDARAAMALFVIASVHCALMLLAIRVASAMVNGWRVFGLAGGGSQEARGDRAVAPIVPVVPAAQAAAVATGPVSRMRGMTMIAPTAEPARVIAGPGAVGGGAGGGTNRTVVMPAAPSATTRPHTPSRARGVGSRFATPVASKERAR